MEAGWTPKLESCRCSQKAMGFEMSTAMVETELRSFEMEDEAANGV